MRPPLDDETVEMEGREDYAVQMSKLRLKVLDGGLNCEPEG